MPRTRQLKHDFFLNEDLACLEPMVRLLFQGLWVIADREGRLEDRPARIKAQIFPYHDADIHAMLGNLVPEFIVRYQSAKGPLLQILNFKKHQHIHPDEKQSTFPPPSEIPGNPHARSEIMPYSSSPSPSPSPSPSSKQTGQQKLAGVGFEKFWNAYPKRVKKQDAIKAWKKSEPDEDTIDKILNAIEQQKKSDDWRRGYIPHPTTWINGKRWEDEQTTQPNDNVHSAEATRKFLDEQGMF